MLDDICEDFPQLYLFFDGSRSISFHEFCCNYNYTHADVLGIYVQSLRLECSVCEQQRKKRCRQYSDVIAHSGQCECEFLLIVGEFWTLQYVVHDVDIGAAAHETDPGHEAEAHVEVLKEEEDRVEEEEKEVESLEGRHDLHTLDLEERQAGAREEDTYLVAEGEDYITVLVDVLVLLIWVLFEHFCYKSVCK